VPPEALAVEPDALGGAAGTESEVVPGVALPRLAALSGDPLAGLPGLTADPVAPTPGVPIDPALEPIIALARVHCPPLPADAVPLVPVAPLVELAPLEAPPRCKHPVTVTVRLLGLVSADWNWSVNRSVPTSMRHNRV